MENLFCTEENAPLFLDWIENRGGIAVWKSVDLGQPDASWSTPALTLEGRPTPAPSWKTEKKPSRVVTRAEEVTVSTDEEVKRFRVTIEQMGSRFQCTAGSSKKIRKAVEKAGVGSYHSFDYAAQEAIIFKSVKTVLLSDHVKSV